MKPDDFSLLAELVRRRSGLVLPTHKAPLIEGRLASVMRRFGFRSALALINELKHGHDALARAVSEAMTTNESYFFRDKAVFDKLRDSVLPRLIAARASSKRLRI
jgi:chemotaxis protein methyltransferase CheR